MSDENGDAMVIWCLAIAVLLLLIGGLTIDLWRGIAVQRQLQAAANAAATAGASGIDVVVYRQTGCVRLDPSTAIAMADDNLAQQRVSSVLAGAGVSVNEQATTITVTLTEDVHLTLLKLVEGSKPLVVRAAASSSPVGSIADSRC